MTTLGGMQCIQREDESAVGALHIVDVTIGELDCLTSDQP